MDSAAASVSAGAIPVGPLAAANTLLHASALTCVTQPANMLASVAKHLIRTGRVSPAYHGWNWLVLTS